MVSQFIQPVVKPYADALKLDAAEVASDTFNLGIGSGIDLLNNILLGGIGAKVMGFTEGIAAQYVAGSHVKGQDSKDLRLIGSYLMWQLLDPKPEDLVALANAIAELKSAVQFGDWSRFSRAFGVKSPTDIMRELDTVGRAFGRVFALPAAAPSPPPPAPPTYQPPLAAPTKVIQFG